MYWWTTNALTERDSVGYMGVSYRQGLVLKGLDGRVIMVQTE